MDAPAYLQRLVDPLIEDLFAEFPALMLVGPRATGKTTTAMRHVRTVVRLDREAEAAAFRADPDGALRACAEPVLLDEWQAVPDVLGAVKRAVDGDYHPGRFILTGSVWADFGGRSWPGTGRVVHVNMACLTMREIVGNVGRPCFVDLLVDGRWDELTTPAELPDLMGYIELALRGGFPQVAIRDNRRRRRWLSGYVSQVITRDVEVLDADRDHGKLRNYLEALAMNTAGVVADRTLYEAAGITAKTAQAYDRLFRDLLILDKIPAWFSNRLKRLIRTPKRYLVDPALAASVLQVDESAVIRDGNLVGRLIDTFVASQLRAEVAISDAEPRMYHLRQDQGRHEIDIVLELGMGRVVAIEIKAKAGVGMDDVKHLAWLRDELGDKFVIGVVFYTGRYIFKLEERIIAVPICAMWG